MAELLFRFYRLCPVDPKVAPWAPVWHGLGGGDPSLSLSDCISQNHDLPVPTVEHTRGVIKLHNLPPSASYTHVLRLAAKYGAVTDVYILRGRQSHRREAVVLMTNTADAQSFL